MLNSCGGPGTLARDVLVFAVFVSRAYDGQAKATTTTDAPFLITSPPAMTGGAKSDRQNSYGGAGKRSRSTNNDSNSNNDNRSSGGHKRPKHGAGEHQRSNKSRQRQQQPKRGGPGFLLTCEAGRESRCRGEGLDLIRHYYYHNHGGGDGVVSNTQSSAGVDIEKDGGADDAASSSANAVEAAASATVSEKKELSLEEEIALLQSGASADDVLFANSDRKHGSKMDDDAAGAGGRRPERVGRKRAPFAIYDTGCKGTVIVLCTLPGCRLVNPDISGADSGKDGDIIGSGGKDDATSAAAATSIAAAAADDSKDTADSHEVDGISPQQKADTDPSEPTPTPSWNPVEVMEQVINDMIATSSSFTGKKPIASEAARDAPSTRHVTRLVPLQATCFAAMEDIIKTAKPLLEKYLISEVKRRQLGADGTDEDKARPTTFEIVFKRRFNSKVRRDPLIDAMAKLIAELRKSNNVDDGALAVDLKNPDYSIQIEVVQNICGMSVVPGGKSYRKFNLVELMESGLRVGSDGDDGSNGNVAERDNKDV